LKTQNENEPFYLHCRAVSPETGSLQRYVSIFGGKFLRFFVPVEINVFFYFYFATTIPVEIPVVDKLMLERPPIPSIDRPDLLCKKPCERAKPDQAIFGQQDARPRVIESPEREKYVFPNTIAKTINKHSHKLSKKNPDIGFK
jgi:hypothetical protein